LDSLIDTPPTAHLHAAFVRLRVSQAEVSALKDALMAAELATGVAAIRLWFARSLLKFRTHQAASTCLVAACAVYSSNGSVAHSELKTWQEYPVGSACWISSTC